MHWTYRLPIGRTAGALDIRYNFLREKETNTTDI